MCEREREGVYGGCDAWAWRTYDVAVPFTLFHVIIPQGTLGLGASCTGPIGRLIVGVVASPIARSVELIRGIGRFHLADPVARSAWDAFSVEFLPVGAISEQPRLKKGAGAII